MSTQFVTLIQSAEGGTGSTLPYPTHGRVVARSGLRGLISRWTHSVSSREQRLAA